MKIALVIPCYNEERRLKADAFARELSDNQTLSVLFVNDGSKDNTLQVLKTISETHPERISYISLDKNKGKAEAVRAGMFHFLKNGSYDLIGFWDADLAVPLSEVNDFVDIFKSNPRVKAVIGSRIHLAGREIEYVKFRHHLGRILATVMCFTFDFAIYDTQCGAKIFERDALSSVVEEPFYSNWIFDVELIIRLTRLASFRKMDNWLYEVPVKEWKNISGTKRNISAYAWSFIDYVKLVRKYLLKI